MPFTRQELKVLLVIIAFGVLIRIYGIWQPLVDSWCWQEAETATIAENFYTHGFNILYPKVNWGSSAQGQIPSVTDWSENSVGYVGTEFPLVSFMAATGYLLFGVADWLGRFISVCFFALSVPFLYLLLRRISATRIGAMIATGVFTLIPLNVFMGREFMPDMASLSLSVIALYFFIECVEKTDHAQSFWLAGLATALAILVRFPAIVIGLPFFYIAWTRFGPAMYATKRLWGLLAITLLPSALWYGHAYHVSQVYLPNHFFWEGGIQIASLVAFLKILSHTATSGVTPFIAAAILAGLALPGSGKYGWLFHWWFLALILFVVVAGENYAHPWTQAAIVPIGAAMTGRMYDFLSQRIPKRPRLQYAFLAGTIVFLCGFAVSAYAYMRPWSQPQAEPLRRAGTVVSKVAPGDALVAVAGDGNPVAFYYSRRRCLRFRNPANDAEAIAQLKVLHDSGATHLVFTSSTRDWLENFKWFKAYLHGTYRLAYQQEDATLFELIRPVAKPSGNPIVPYRLIQSEMRRFPGWVHVVVQKPPTDQELIDLALELHAKYPETHFNICDDASGLQQLDRATDNLNLFFPGSWAEHHYFAMINVIEEGGYPKWRLAGCDAHPTKRDKIIADLAGEPYRPWRALR